MHIYTNINYYIASIIRKNLMIKILLLSTLLFSSCYQSLASASQKDDLGTKIDVWAASTETGLAIFAKETCNIPTTDRRKTTMTVKDLATGGFTNICFEAAYTTTGIDGTGHIINTSQEDSTIDKLKAAIAEFESRAAAKKI
jgi:hypothetical protein